MEKRNILEIARLIRVMEDECISMDEKVAQIKMVRDNGDISQDEALELVLEYTGYVPQRIIRGAEAFYTGGGIWMSAMYLDKNIYCAINSEAIDNYYEEDDICFYDHRGEDDDIEYPCQNFIGAKLYKELSPDELDLYWELRDELVKEAWW